MTGQQLKQRANEALDQRATRLLGRTLTFEERRAWWCSPQGGVDDPALLVVVGTDAERAAVVKAAKRWRP